MPIIYDSVRKLFNLKTPNSSYIFRLNGDYILQHLYYGGKIEDVSGIENISDEAYKGATLHAVDAEYKEEGLSTGRMLQEYPFYGSTDLRIPAFHASYTDGSRVTKMKYISHRIYKGKPVLKGLPSTYVEKVDDAETLEITMFDKVTGLKLIYNYTAFSYIDAITRSVVVVNEGTDIVNIEKIMSASVDFDKSNYDIIHLHGDAWRECTIERKSLVSGEIKISSARGSSSHLHSPFFALVSKNSNEESGEAYGFSLVYSGNFEAGVEVDSFDNTRAYIGINSFDFNWCLNPDESFVTPEAIMTYSANGIGGMSKSFHDLYRKNLARGKYRDKVRPILINNWEATYMDFNEEKIVDIATKAKDLGIDLIVLDDGWFGKRNDDKSSLGDWRANKEKLPNGIEGLAEKIESLGMKFGLWFEPEMVSPDSDLYREHSDWCVHIKSRNKSMGRNQLILDLSRTEVCEYIISAISEILKCGKISYIKWDMNRNFTEIGSAKISSRQQKEVAHRYILGLYSILEKIKKDFPDVLMEGCASGGGRFDPGMMYYFNQFWTSDNSDGVDRASIQYGASLVMPVMFMGAHVSAVPNHQNNRMTPMKTRGLVAMCGQFGYELDVTKLSKEELKEIKEQINLYKRIRQTVQFGTMYRLKSPFEGNDTVFEFVSPDKCEICIFHINKLCMVQKNPERVKLRGLEQNGKYSDDSGNIYSSEYLLNFGLFLSNLDDFSSELIILRKVN